MRRTSQKSFQTHFSITIIKVTYFHLQQRVPKNLTSTSILGIYVKRKKKKKMNYSNFAEKYLQTQRHFGNAINGHLHCNGLNHTATNW